MRWPMLVLAIANNFHMAESRTTPNREQRWTEPEPKHIKLNVDAAYFEDGGATAISSILRDEKGMFLAVRCTYIPHAADAISMEARALCDDLNFTNQLGFSRIEAESDSLNLYS